MWILIIIYVIGLICSIGLNLKVTYKLKRKDKDLGYWGGVLFFGVLSWIGFLVILSEKDFLDSQINNKN